MREIIVYDKSSYHYGSCDDKKLNRDQAFVHIVFLGGWIVERGLLNLEIVDDFESEIKLFNNRSISGPKLIRLLGGALVSDMLSDEGNDFSMAYYLNEEKGYINDYCNALCPDESDVYAVEDNLINYNSIKKVLDLRLNEWRKG